MDSTQTIPRQFRTAVVPAAGLGTRFLPATKSVPKELLPVVDTPGIELVAEEAADAGADRMIIVTSPEKQSVAEHFAECPELEDTLARRGKFDLLERVRRAPKLLEVETALQPRPLGLGHAVLQAESSLAADETAIAVLLPDDLVGSGVLETMAEVRRRWGGSVLCAIEVPHNQVSAYGIFDVAAATDTPDVLRVNGMVEKPAVEDAPSNLAAAGRYLLDRAIFDALRRITPGAGGEYQLTDAIALLIAENHPVHVVIHRGPRHDIGTPTGHLRAAVDFALQREEYAGPLRDWLLQRLGVGE
ncbi:UTP--glucose-1-phosphate uridylyltransferase [Nocardia alni]|uniref:UTP--glucose-1-phosphate uridylyltransferase n=1 Tax=Nocardia alni TaxID=2815723 RepID=UPI001C240BF6|nr:UTP--glucose-1-phosphate uridylyltransferase [Nocardia alni]